MVMSVYADCCYELEDDFEEAEEALEEAKRVFEAAKEAFRAVLLLDDTEILELASELLNNAIDAKEATEADEYDAWLWLVVCQESDHWYGTFLSGGCESGGCD